MNALKQEFIDLMVLSGWSQAEAARELSLSRGGVNGIVTGPHDPGEKTVKLFRMILMDKMPWVFKTNANPEKDNPKDVREVMNELQQIRRVDPQAFDAVRNVISTYSVAARRKGRTRLTNSKVASVAAASAPSALKRALHEDRASRPSPKAGAPNDGKAAPKTGTEKNSKKPPGSPDQAPKQ